MADTKTTTTKSVKEVKAWTPNEKQAKFLKTLEAADRDLTLAEISEQIGIDLKSGSVNGLIAKGLVEHGPDRTMVVMKPVKTTVKTWRLAGREYAVEETADGEAEAKAE